MSKIKKRQSDLSGDLIKNNYYQVTQDSTLYQDQLNIRFFQKLCEKVYPPNSIMITITNIPLTFFPAV